VVLAEEEKKLGLPIRSSQIAQMRRYQHQVNLKRVREYEKRLRHDVMSHVKAFGEQARLAEPIIHLGARSCYVTDNSDALILRDATEIVLSKAHASLEALRSKIDRWRGVPASGFTHFQPAQPVTVGKRLALWAQDLMWDVEELEFVLSRLQPLGCKGATGTQASFLVLFNGNEGKVKKLDDRISKRLGFDRSVPLSGQTLSRKVDIWFVNALASLAATLSKISYDLRLLQHLGEMREPFGDKQIGSSAMAYKRNPMLAERMTSLSRFLMTLAQNPLWTQATQWLERSLDDSANRRIVIAEAFLTADALLEIAQKIFSGLELDQENTKRRLETYAHYFQTEVQMMKATLKGKSRQGVHEEIRKATMGGRLVSLKAGRQDLRLILGRAESQATEFLKSQLNPFLKKRSRRILRKASGAPDWI
jgi:adenylosuccinate lyase